MNQRLTGWKLALLLLVPISVLLAAFWIAWNAFSGNSSTELVAVEQHEQTAQSTPEPSAAQQQDPANQTPLPVPTAQVVPTPTAMAIETENADDTEQGTQEETGSEDNTTKSQPEATSEPTPAPQPTAVPVPTSPPAPTPVPQTAPPKPVATAAAPTQNPPPAAPPTGETADGTDPDATVQAPPEGVQIYCSQDGTGVPERLQTGGKVGPLSVQVLPGDAAELFDYTWDFGTTQQTGPRSGQVTYDKAGTYAISVLAKAKATGAEISTGCGRVEVYDPKTELQSITCSTAPADSKIKPEDAQTSDPMKTVVTWKPASLVLNLQWDYLGEEPLILANAVTSPQSRQRSFGNKSALIRVKWINPQDNSQGTLDCPIFK